MREEGQILMGKENDYIKPFVSFLFFSVVIFLIDLLVNLSYVRYLGTRTVVPVSYFTQRMTDRFSNVISFYTQTMRVYKENTALKAQNQALIGVETLNKQLEEENVVLRRSLNVGSNTEISKLMSDVIGMEEGNFSGYIIVNKGMDDKVEKGMPLVIDNRMVGVIDEAYKSSAKVKLIESADSLIPAKIIGKNNTFSFLQGNFGLKLKLTKIEQDADVKEGDIVVTSGQGGTLPEGLVLGKVSSVSKKVETMLYQEADVDPLTNLSDLNEVIILLKSHY